MCACVLAANILVQFPFTPFGLEDYLTWGAFTYPVTFLVNDLSNRRLGLRRTRMVVYTGFALAVLLSILFATPRIALASGTAFLISQLLDATVFDRLRRRAWWMPPLTSASSLRASTPSSSSRLPSPAPICRGRTGHFATMR